MTGSASRRWAVTCLCALSLALTRSAFAQTSSVPRPIDVKRDVGLDQKPNSQVPLDLRFRDETGRSVRLGDLFDEKPVVLTLVWYKCPGICGVELESLTQSLRRQKLQLGRDYSVVTLSINPKETPALAAAKKAQYAAMYGRPGTDIGWHFLVGDDPSIHALAASVGYRYAYDAASGQYAHPAGVIVLTPGGRVSRYLFGLDYPDKDLSFALSEASGGRTGSLVQSAIICTCFQYDPVTGRYSVAIGKIMALAGALTVAAIAVGVLLLRRSERRHLLDGPQTHTAHPGV